MASPAAEVASARARRPATAGEGEVVRVRGSCGKGEGRERRWGTRHGAYESRARRQMGQRSAKSPVLDKTGPCRWTYCPSAVDSNRLRVQETSSARHRPPTTDSCRAPHLIFRRATAEWRELSHTIGTRTSCTSNRIKVKSIQFTCLFACYSSTNLGTIPLNVRPTAVRASRGRPCYGPISAPTGGIPRAIEGRVLALSAPSSYVALLVSNPFYRRFDGSSYLQKCRISTSLWSSHRLSFVIRRLPSVSQL